MRGEQGRCKTLSDSAVTEAERKFCHIHPPPSPLLTAQSDEEDNACPANLGYGGKRRPLHWKDTKGREGDEEGGESLEERERD